MKEQLANRVLVSGRYFTEQDLRDVTEIVRMFPNLSRSELAKTVCENLEWYTANGRLKLASCYQLFNKLEKEGLIILPPKQESMIRCPGDKIEIGPRTEAGERIEGKASDLEPLDVRPLRRSSDNRLWNEYVERYHVLGYKRPFGAHQRYFIVSGADSKPLGCLLFAAAAWALAPRDRWIGWAEVDRHQRLNLVLNNTRFLIFPWVRVKNLASKVLSLVAKRIREDWQQRYGYRPVLLETFIDPEQYRGTCYQAANWIYLGRTQGRGRMDRYKKRLLSRKDIYVYPLTSDFRASLRGEEQ